MGLQEADVCETENDQVRFEIVKDMLGANAWLRLQVDRWLEVELLSL